MSVPRTLAGIRLTEMKRIADILFGEQVIKVKINEKTRIYEIFVDGSIDIPSDMQKRFSEKMKLCKIISMYRQLVKK